jgi:hypothetical protein
MPHYLCKLRPPRAAFIADMTSDEALLMRAHREYWTPRVETGVVVAMGPVADPAALEAMQASDPVIAAASGFSYENHLMPMIAVRPSMPLAPITSVTP